MAEQYEYAQLSVYTNGLDAMVQRLNDLAAEGWELVTTHSVDRTIGVNAITALIRRPIDRLPLPEVMAEDWYADPSGRFDKRYWNGRAWTFHVARVDDKSRHRDPPTQLPPTPDIHQ